MADSLLTRGGPRVRLAAIGVIALLTAGITGCVPAPGAPVAVSPSPTPSAVPSAGSTASAGDRDVEGGAGGESAAGGSDPAGSGSGGSGAAPDGGAGQPSESGNGAAPAPPADPVAPPAAAVVVAVTDQKCVSGRLTIQLTANAGSGYRKGIASIGVERANEYDVWIGSEATWLGPETGAGDRWTAQPAGSRAQDFKDTLRVTASAESGAGTTTISVPITAPC